MHEENLDDLIRGKLENAEFSFSEEDWEDMERSLDGLAGEEKNPFDEQVAALLAHHSTYLRPADWDEMVEHLEAPFDEAVRRKLEFHSVGKPGPYAWMLMRARLRAAEGAFRYGPWLTAAATVSLVLISTWLISPGKLSRNTSGEAFAAEYRLPEANPAQNAGANSQKQQAYESGLPRVQTIPVFDEVIPIPDPVEGASARLEGPPPQPAFSGVMAHNTTETPQDEPEKPGIHRLPIRFSHIGNPNMGQTAMRFLRRASRKRIPNMSAETYIANTSTRAELSGPDAGPGFMVGARAVFPVGGNWSVVTGMQYGKKKFSHEYYVISDRAYLNAVEGELNVIEAPLMLRHTFPSRKKISLFAQAGVVTMLSLSEEYKHYDPVAPANRGILTLEPVEYLKPQVQQRRLNTYPGNILMALGLRYKLNEELALQAEPYFQQGIQRTKGSDSFRFEKKLSTAGMGLGLSWKFNRKEESEHLVLAP